MFDVFEGKELVKISSLLEQQNTLIQQHNQEVIAYLKQQNEMIYYLKQYIETNLHKTS